jgi:dTMP kinase
MFFVTFEGIEGSGKTTICKQLLTKLMELNYKVKLIREPGGSELTEPIRQLIINNETKFTPLAEVFLFFASQLQNNYIHLKTQ